MGVAGDIDQQVAQQTVDHPRRDFFTRLGHLSEGDFHFVERVVARFIDARRLRGRADEQAGKQVRQRWMVMPVAEQAAQQVRATQERRIRRCRPAEHEVVAAAGAGVPAVDQ